MRLKPANLRCVDSCKTKYFWKKKYRIGWLPGWRFLWWAGLHMPFWTHSLPCPPPPPGHVAMATPTRPDVEICGPNTLPLEPAQTCSCSFITPKTFFGNSARSLVLGVGRGGLGLRRLRLRRTCEGSLRYVYFFCVRLLLSSARPKRKAGHLKNRLSISDNKTYLRRVE